MALYEMPQTEFGGAASAPATDALFQLGLKYATGRDCPVDLVTAHQWLNIAAMRGNSAARSMRMELAEEMSKAEIMRAQRQAREWIARH